MRHILTDLGITARGSSAGAGIGRLLSEQIRDDFRDGRIIRVDGWMFSLTETRLYALAALLT